MVHFEISNRYLRLNWTYGKRYFIAEITCVIENITNIFIYHKKGYYGKSNRT